MRLATLLTIGVLISIETAPVRSFQAPKGLGPAIDRYARGDFDGALVDATAAENLKHVGRWPRELREWAEAGVAKETSDRVRVATAFALELVARRSDGSPAEYQAVVPLLDAACAVVDKDASKEHDHLFHLAAVALLQGAGDAPLVYKYSRHAAGRHPDSRFLLAGVTVSHAWRLIASRPLFHRFMNLFGAVDPGNQADTDDLRRRLSDVTRLAGDPTVGLEVHLRRGVLTFLMREPGDGRDDFLRASTSTDPQIAYLAHMMLGILQERAGHAGDAIAEYGRAYALIPAPSASRRLSYALFMTGRSAEAGELATNLRFAEQITDPWYLYGLGDYRLWPAYQERLRASIK